MNDIARVAEQVRAQAEREEATAFDRQYQLARRTERVLAALEADGRARARQWAEDDRREDSDRRFDPELDDSGPEEAGRAAHAPPRAAPAARRTGAAPDADDEEDEPTTWLR